MEVGQKVDIFNDHTVDVRMPTRLVSSIRIHSSIADNIIDRGGDSIFDDTIDISIDLKKCYGVSDRIIGTYEIIEKTHVVAHTIPSQEEGKDDTNIPEHDVYTCRQIKDPRWIVKFGA